MVKKTKEQLEKGCGKTIRWEAKGTAYQHRIYCDKCVGEYCEDCKKKLKGLEGKNENRIRN